MLQGERNNETKKRSSMEGSVECSHRIKILQGKEMAFMQANTLSKGTIVKSILFVIGFWTIVGICMYWLYCLLEVVDITALITQLLGI